jgi:hypothetical protein
MAPVLLVVYCLPMYNIEFLWLNVEASAVRDGQGRIVSILYTEANNVRLFFTTKYKNKFNGFFSQRAQH